MSPGKGQTSIEFVMMMAIVIFIGTVFLGIANTSFQRTALEERIAAISDVGFTIQDELILATTVADGYTRTMIVPQAAGRFTYDLTNTPTLMYIESEKLSLTFGLPNITGTITKGENEITKEGQVTVS